MTVRKKTVVDIVNMKREGKKIAALTAYDCTFARILDDAGIDLILVGDSAGNVIAGHDTTIPVKLNEMIYHGRSVARCVKQALVVVDMPFGSYQVSDRQALKNAIRVIKHTGADAVKLEGGREVASSIRRIVDAGIPVMGHLGLLPQSIRKIGRYRVVGRDEKEAARLLEDAKILEEAGCFSIVLEKVPVTIARKITETISIPTIGIGAGPYTDGQILVIYDMLGMNPEFKPRFVRTYANLYEAIRNATEAYIADVRNGSFPDLKESYE